MIKFNEYCRLQHNNEREHVHCDTAVDLLHCDTAVDLLHCDTAVDSCTAIRRWSSSCTAIRRWDTRSVVLLQNHCTVVRKWRTYTLVRRQSAGAVIQWWRACQIELVITFIWGVYKCNLRDVEVTDCDICPEFVSWAITAAVIVLITFSKFAEAPARQSNIKTTLQM